MNRYNYHCFNSQFREKQNCPYCSKGQIILDEEDNNFTCPNNQNETLKLMGEICHGGPVIKLTRQEIQKERKQRSSNHFKKEVLPTFDKGSDEAIHFAKKTK